MNCSWNNNHIVVNAVKCPIRFHPTEVQIVHPSGVIIKDRIMHIDIGRYEKIHKNQSYEFDEDHVFLFA